MKVGAIVQARTSSSRLPGKVLKQLPYGGKDTVIDHVINRVSKVSSIDEVILATSTTIEDDALIAKAKEQSIPFFRGSLENVLERYHDAAKYLDLDLIVRVTSDCPCIDSDLIERGIQEHLNCKADFSSSGLKRTLPFGLDFGIINRDALEIAYRNATLKYELEHVTTYFYKTCPSDFKINVIEAKGDENHPEIRVTLDTAEDYVLLCAIYDELYTKNPFFGIGDLVDLFRRKPWLLKINESIKQKQVHDSLKSEIGEVIAYCENQGLRRFLEYMNNNELA